MKSTLKTSDFYFDLPKELIAQYPTEKRGSSRLLVMDRKAKCREHRMVGALPSILESGTLMVFNNSRVRKARLFGISETSGKKHEFLLLKKLDDFSWETLVKRAGRRKPGSAYNFDGVRGEIVSVEGSGGGEGATIIRFEKPINDSWLDIHGHMPLPPYIKREDRNEDDERYQTIYAREYGSAAAPTAGLHFTGELLRELEKAGMECAFIKLHVGLGTFLPVRTEYVEDHKMHEESYSIDEKAASQIENAKAEGRKILAIGTTSLRTLESAWDEEGRRIKRGEGVTSIFIYGGYNFKIVDALFTNFHTPESTLLMLVSAFAGRDFIVESYREAIKEGYRFFSYGDACLIM